MVFVDRGRMRLLALTLLVFATASSPAFAFNCVEYVRNVSGMAVSGNGWQWWANAVGLYQRGHQPKENAIMVFNRTSSMESGHVAIVSRILAPRFITINHANWAHLRSLKGRINTGVMVEDVSEKNDWSEVKVMDQESQSYGRSNPILGFVYNKPGSGTMVAANSAALEEAAISGSIPGSIPESIRDIDNE